MNVISIVRRYFIKHSVTSLNAGLCPFNSRAVSSKARGSS